MFISEQVSKSYLSGLNLKNINFVVRIIKGE